MKLFLISIASVFVVFISLLTTRFWGMGQVHPEFQHPFFVTVDAPQILVYKTSLPETIDTEISKHKGLILWLDVNITKDNQLIVINDSDYMKKLTLENFKEKWKGNKLPAYEYEDLKAVFPLMIPLENYLTKFPEQKFIINLVDNVPDLHLLTIKTIEPHKPDRRILIQSDTAVNISSIKEIKPAWVYGSSYADTLKLTSMDSLWILPAAGFKGDAYISPLKLLERPAFNSNVIEELQRRKKKIILGPLTTPDDFEKAKEFKPDGIIYNEQSSGMV